MVALFGVLVGVPTGNLSQIAESTQTGVQTRADALEEVSPPKPPAEPVPATQRHSNAASADANGVG
jgi:hypothetical protein